MRHLPITRTIMLAATLAAAGAPVLADDWPQWRGPKRDGVWRETGITDKLATDGDGQIKLKWSVEIAAGYSQPTVADHRVYLTDRLEDPEEIERVHCFDFNTGERVWSHSYPARYTIGYKSGPRAAVLIDRDGGLEAGTKATDQTAPRAYALGGVGHLHCFDAVSGEVLWQRDLQRDYRIDLPRWGIAGGPLVEGDLLILQIGGPTGACVIALDKRDGRERWRAIQDDASYAAPIIVDQAGQRVLIVYAADELFGLKVATGEVLWSYALPGSKWPISIATPVVAENEGQRYVFTSNAHVGSALLKLDGDQPAVAEIWRRENPRLSDNLHSLITTPLIRDGYIYGTHVRGELRCLELLTGKRVWESEDAVKPDQFSTLHIIAQGDTGQRVWIFNEHGELIIADLSPEGYRELSRGMLLAPTRPGLPSRRGGVTWAHPAFAYRHVLARSDEALVCADLSAK